MESKRVTQILAEGLKVKDKATKDILNSLTLIIFQEETDVHDLYYLSSLLNHDALINVIDYYDGETIRLPSKKQYRETIILILAFFLKECLNKNWTEIKKILQLKSKDSAREISIGRKINNLKEDIKEKIYRQLKHLQIEEISIIVDTLYGNTKKRKRNKMVKKHGK